MTDTAPRDNLRGGAWLFADMSLNIWALSVVKALGLGYPPSQLVFLRAGVGLVVLSPLIWRHRHAFAAVPRPGLQALRVLLSAVTLTASYYALSRVPLALFSTMNFTRPLVVMLLAALVLHERITPAQWAAACVALLGACVAVDPSATGATAAGIAALAVMVCAGSAAVIATRALRDTPEVVLMALYAAGLSLCALPFAGMQWQAVPDHHLGPLLAVGVFAQLAQLCFLRAHFHGDAGVLAILGYVSLPLSVTVGWFIFGELPAPRFYVGAALVIAAAASLGLTRPRARPRS